MLLIRAYVREGHYDASLSRFLLSLTRFVLAKLQMTFFFFLFREKLHLRH